MKIFFNVFVVFVLLMCSCVFVWGYDDAYFIEAENGFLASEIEDASKAVSMMDTSSKSRSVQATKIIRVPLKVSRKSDGNYFMWSDMSLITFNGEVGFCIDPLIKINMNANYSSNDFHTVLDEHKRNEISKIMYYGYSFENHQTDNYYLATQKLIWECLGYKVKYYAKNSNFVGNYDVSKEENEIVRLLNDHDKTISFDGKSLEMCVGDVIELHDDHLVLDDYVVDYDGDALEIEKVDQTLRIYAKKPLEQEIILRKGDYQVEGAMIKVHKAKSAQPFVTMEKGAIEPLVAKLNLKVHALGDFELVKIDKETQKGLEGVAFEVSTDVNFKENVHRFISNVEGKIEIKNLIVGTYYYREVDTVEPYIKDGNVYSFTINENECTKVVFENTKQKVQLKIKKDAVSMDDFTASSATLDGAEYIVLSNDKSTVIERVKASAQVATVSTLLDVNTTYYVQEVVAPKGMEVNPDLIEVYIPYQKEQGNLIKEVTCYDEVIKNTIDITKYVHVYENELARKQFGENFVFDIYNHKNELVDTIITDANGHAQSKELPYGMYKIQEKVKDGYQVVEPFTVSIDSSTKQYHFEIVNEPIDYQLEILKIDNNDQPLSHVRFAISTDKNMQKILMEKETDENGKLVFHHLVPNTYYVQERYVDEKYVLDPTVYEIEVTKDTQKTFVNALKVVELQIHKYDDIRNPIEHVKFKVTNANGIEEIGSTDTDGRLLFMLPYGDYVIEEMETPKGYIGLEDAITISIDEDREYVVEVMNERKLVELQIHKYDDIRNPIENVMFKVTNANGIEEIGSTDKNGSLLFVLPYGDYVIEEIETPKGYVGLDEAIPLTIDEDKVYTLEVVNTKVPIVDTASVVTPPWIMLVTAVIGIVVGVYLRIYS